METKQIQKAGANSQQTVNNNYYYGMSEERALALYKEQGQIILQLCSEMAKETADSRINQFAEFLLPRVQTIEESFKSFSDPGFQVLLRKAQLAAACSERDNDYKLLSELLVHRIKNKDNIKKKASITKAVEIIDLIDDDSLLALTVFLSMERFIPQAGKVKDGLGALSDLYSKFDLDNLPQSEDTLWIDNLSTLGALTYSSYMELKKFEDILSDKLSGYVCLGIRKSSVNYANAVNALKAAGFDESILVENELADGYCRMPVSNIEFVKEMPFIVQEDSGRIIPVDIDQKKNEALLTVYRMYEKNDAKMENIKASFKTLLNSYQSIHKAISWWNSIHGGITLTSVGRVIGHTNAKSIDNNLPDLD